MDKHMVEWLGAYLDGELSPEIVVQVQSHLSDCPDCRKELAGIKALSGILKSESVLQPDPEKFLKQLKARLPEKPSTQSPNSQSLLIWWLIPLVILVLGFTSRMIVNLTGLMLYASQAGFLGDIARSVAESGWFSINTTSLVILFNSILDENLVAILSNVETASQYVTGFIYEISWLVALAIVCAAWLVVVWNKRSVLQNKSMIQN